MMNTAFYLLKYTESMQKGLVIIVTCFAGQITPAELALKFT
jgi:hypothetical protein